MAYQKENWINVSDSSNPESGAIPITAQIMDKIEQQIAGNTLEIEGINELLGAITSPIILWENPDSTVGFAAQTIALNSSVTEFRRFHIIFKEYINEDSFIECVCTEIDKTHSVSHTEMNNSGSSDNACYNRRFKIESNGNIKFTRCDNPGITDHTDEKVRANKYLIPCKIIGYHY